MFYSARSQILTGYATLARSLRLVPERLTREAGLDLSSLQHLDARVSAKGFADVLERSAEEASATDFGLRLAESRELGILGPIGIVLQQERDVRSALQSLALYLPYHNESLILRLEEETGAPILILEVLTHGRQVTELSIGTFSRVLRHLRGADWRPARVCFEHSAPNEQGSHRRLFGCKVEFDHEFNGIVLHNDDLDSPLAMSDAMLAKYAHRYLDTIILHRPISMAEKTHELVRVLLPSGCSADKVARTLGVDRRTVHRYLADSNQTFSSILTDVRVEVVTALLSDGRPLTEIADRVGLSSAAALSRWFKEKFGRSPSQWRNTLR